MIARREMLAGLLLVAPVAGCASSEPAYFTLAPRPGTALSGGPRTVELRRPGLAGYLDRPEIVRAGGPYQLRLASGERWGEPLGDLIGRIMAENLTTRLQGTTVYTSTGSISSDADASVELDVQRFDLDPSGEVVLLAQVAARRSGQRSATRSVRITERPDGTSTAQMVAAMSTALGRLADAVAGMIRGA